MANILIIVSEEEIGDIVCQILRNKGHEVDVVIDADLAITKIEGSKYTCLLVDLLLPGELTGFKLIGECREKAPEALIISYSQLGEESIACGVIKAGASNFVTEWNAAIAEIA